MRFRLPTVRSGWRQFLADVAIVVLGVIIGLAATQFVADRNTAREVRDTKLALHRELANNFLSVERRHRMDHCVERKIQDLLNWIRTQRRRDTGAVLPDQIGTPGGRQVFTSVWETAKGSDVVSNIPLEERLQYANLYDSLVLSQMLAIEERDTWYEIGNYAGMRLNDRDLARLNGLVRRVDASQRNQVANYSSHVGLFRKLEIRPQIDTLPSPLRRVMCRRLSAAN